MNQELGTKFLKFPTKIFEKFLIPFEGKSVGYTVKALGGDFPISSYPLEQTEFLYNLYEKQGKRKTQYDFSMFRYRKGLQLVRGCHVSVYSCDLFGIRPFVITRMRA